MLLKPRAFTDLDIALISRKDDSEEDLVGSDIHQTAIRAAHDGLQLAGPEQGLPWHVSMQLMVVMDAALGYPWKPSPDIMVHPTAGPAPRTSFDVAADGVPPLLIEVASPSTWPYDVDAKGRLYQGAGVGEYLVFDPTGELLGRQVLAWRGTPAARAEWLPEADGRWHSESLGVSFVPEGLLLRVFDRRGRLMPTLSEQARQTAELQRRIDELEAENRRLRGEPT